VDLRKVKKLIELVEESGIAELEVSSGDESVRIAMYGERYAGTLTPAPQAAPAPTSHTPADTQSGSQTTINAPMAGTFYRAPNPEAAPFLEVGDRIEEGQVVCIIESMKMMHEIKSDVSGTVVQICIANGQPIGTQERLFKLS